MVRNRAGGARSVRRTSSRISTAYEQAVEHGDGGGYLRREGLYSSLISEWRKQRDAGVLSGRKPGEKVGKLTAEQAEIARLNLPVPRLEVWPCRNAGGGRDRAATDYAVTGVARRRSQCRRVSAACRP